MTRRPGEPRGRVGRPRWATAVAASSLSLLSVAAAPLAGPPVQAPTVTPAAANPTATSAVENEPVRFTRSADGSTGKVAPAPSALNNSVADLWHVSLALAFVVVLIFLLRSVARRLSLVPDGGKGGRGVRVLSRTVLSPKQQVLLLQVGRRIVVVGDSGAGGMRSLCEIADPDEVAALIGEAKAAGSGAMPPARSFGNLFRRASEPFDGSAAEPDRTAPGAASPESEVPGEVAGLLDKVRGLRQRFER